MSVTFTAARFDTEKNYYRPLASCDCCERYSRDWDIADAAGDEYPAVYSCEVCANEINLANSNAWEFLTWLDIPVDYCGAVEARDLAAKCRRRLWDEERNHDPAISGEESGGPGTGQCRSIICGRRPDYLRSTTERMLKLAEQAGDNFVSWA